MNPTQNNLETRLSMLDKGAAAVALASGQCASYYSILNLCRHGDNVITSRNMYGGTTTLMQHLLPSMGIQAQLFDSNNPDEIKKLVNDRTRGVFVEGVSNPALEITDIEAVSKIAKDNNLPLIVDATFQTPYLCNVIDHGADIVMHSLTKWIGGHGTGIGGIVIDSGKFDWKNSNNPNFVTKDMSYHGLTWATDLPDFLAPVAYILRLRTVPLRTLGGCISPDNAWMFLQGLETLPLRMERHCSNALAMAEFLESHPDVAWVRFPGLKNDKMYDLNKKYLSGKGGSVVVFELKNGLEAGKNLSITYEYLDILQM
eukprot:UN06580